LAAFVAGIVFNFAGSSDAKESQEEIQEAISRFFDLPIFVLLGMTLPWQGWLDLGWRGPLLVVAVLLLRRLPAVLTLRSLLGPLRGRAKDVLFLGWFGPIVPRRSTTRSSPLGRRAWRKLGWSAAW
jgi:NhaP-type Na+/H+ or K+/H+ antiporter